MFSQKTLKFATYDLSGNLPFQGLDSENSGQVLFDFLELEDLSGEGYDRPGYGNDFVEWLTSLSCSLKQTYFNSAVDRLKRNLSEAHSQARDFFTEILSRLREKDFEESLKNLRFNLQVEFTEILKQMNKGYLVNNMDMITLSLPLEYSLVNNYWVIHGL